MKMIILGAGPLGSLIGAHLARAGDVRMTFKGDGRTKSWGKARPTIKPFDRKFSERRE